MRRRSRAGGLVIAVAIAWFASVTYLALQEPDDGPSRPLVVSPSPTPTVTAYVAVTKPVPGPTVHVTATATATATVTATATRTVQVSRNETRTPTGFAEWLASPTAQLVLRRESHGICTAVNPSGKYRGRWQMDSNFWRSYGGLEYASTPDRASCHQQDLVAYRGWLARGWSPWPTAG